MPHNETIPHGPDERHDETRVTISALFVGREFMMLLPPRRFKSKR
jgi:hypothetical protein